LLMVNKAPSRSRHAAAGILGAAHGGVTGKRRGGRDLIGKESDDKKKKSEGRGEVS